METQSLDLLSRIACLVLAIMLLGFVAVLGVAVARLWIEDKKACRVTSCDKVVRDVRY